MPPRADIRASEAREKTFLSYTDVTAPFSYGVKSLLDDQIAPERRPAALIRMKKYTGIEPGYTPIMTQAEERFRERLKMPGLLGPSKMSVEKNLENTNAYLNGIGLLLEKHKIQGYQPVFARLKEQIASYDDFVRKEVLPGARTDFRLPPAIYAIQLERFGVDYTPAELQRLAHRSFHRYSKANAGYRREGCERAGLRGNRLPVRNRRTEEGTTQGGGRAAALPAAPGGDRGDPAAGQTPSSPWLSSSGRRLHVRCRLCGRFRGRS